jgi:hypothetical protein
MEHVRITGLPFCPAMEMHGIIGLYVLHKSSRHIPPAFSKARSDFIYKNKKAPFSILRRCCGRFVMKRTGKKILSFSKADTASDTSLFTDYLPTINETIDSSGFKHPGVGLTKDTLETMRTDVRAGAEP